MKKRKILFLGETYRADAITWIEGLKAFGNFDIVTWELQNSSKGFWKRVFRFAEFYLAVFQIKKIVKNHKPDMVIAERTTSYGFLAAFSGIKPTAIAQQGRTDLWPEVSVSMPLKRKLQQYAFRKADLIHAWGPIMAKHMQNVHVDMHKVMVLPKGINLEHFQFSQKLPEKQKITAIVTRSLLPEYRHETILKAFAFIRKKGIDFELVIVGDGNQTEKLKALATLLQIADQTNFTGRIDNKTLPTYLQQADFYISMPNTEGVSASLFEAMACGCYPVVSDIEGNQSWINHRENGQLVSVDAAKMLADELIWAFENPEYRKEVVAKNRVFVEEHANYSINMKLIAEKYHQLIDRFQS